MDFEQQQFKLKWFLLKSIEAFNCAMGFRDDSPSIAIPTREKATGSSKTEKSTSPAEPASGGTGLALSFLPPVKCPN